MSNTGPTQFLSIGEFAAATQLSPKALRLYDEQRLLAPAKVDAVTGYRYYRADQVAVGRLIRTLREMNLSLGDVERILTAQDRAEWVLTELNREQDIRHAREKSAMQKALKLLRHADSASPPAITTRSDGAMTVAVQPFVSNRARLFDHVRTEATALQEKLSHLGVGFAPQFFCDLIDPISDDDGRVELLVPLNSSASSGVVVRSIAPASRAILDNPHDLPEIDFTAAQDALFDWFDRNGVRAQATPWLGFATRPLRYAAMTWAFESKQS